MFPENNDVWKLFQIFFDFTSTQKKAQKMFGKFSNSSNFAIVILSQIAVDSNVCGPTKNIIYIDYFILTWSRNLSHSCNFPVRRSNSTNFDRAS